MSTVHYNQNTTSTPEQFIAGLTDFGPGREKLFGKSADSYLRVRGQGTHEADVTEGSGGVWERLHYDWSDPNRVVHHRDRLQRVGRAVGLHLHHRPQPDGTTDIDVVNVREGKNLKGRVLALILGTVGKRVLVIELEKTIKAIEAREYGADPADFETAAAGVC